MAKILLVMVVVLVAAWALFGRNRTLRGPGSKAPPGTTPGAEEIVPCAHCGVHLPRADAVMDGEQAYCSAAHRTAGPRGG